MSLKPLVLIIGATGAQGKAVISRLLQEGNYRVRALTRDKASESAQSLLQYGDVELISGKYTDDDDLEQAFKGVDMAFVNTDGFSIAPPDEIFTGIRIYEIARKHKVKHYVYSSLPDVGAYANYRLEYMPVHLTSKARVARYIKSFPSTPEMRYTILESGPYAEMLSDRFRPSINEETGIARIPNLFGRGHIIWVPLDFYGLFTSWALSHPEAASGRTLPFGFKTSGEELRAAYEEVTGRRAELIDGPIEQLVRALFGPVISDKSYGVGTGGVTWAQNFTRFFSAWSQDLIPLDERSMDEIAPNRIRNIKQWMQSVGYDGSPKQILKPKPQPSAK